MAPTILVVDDNDMVRELVQGMLNATGYRALSAEDGATALAVYAGNAIDAAILDVDMPGMTGVDLCRALHAQAAATHHPLVVWLMTGNARPELEPAARAAGAVGVLAKPFSKQELMACFHHVEAHVPEHSLTT
jgi:CheY-like chemotaxis protein